MVLMVMEEWDSFFADVVSFLRLSAAREESATHDIDEATVLKFDSLLSVLSAIRQSILQDPCSEQDLLCIAPSFIYDCTGSSRIVF